jgi:aminopeptidase YwaD
MLQTGDMKPGQYRNRDTIGDPLMWADFQSLCDLGGRLAGSASETAALAFAGQRLAAVPGAKVRDDPLEYPGWRCRTAQLTHATTGVSLPCTPLLGSASAAGVVAEVLDLGLGRVEDFARHANAVRGRIVMVGHEYPFAAGHVHRRVKLALAQQMGAVGFLIVHPERGVGAVSGSSGRNGGDGIPALGIAVEAADVLRRSPRGTLASASMVIEGDDHPALTRMLIADLPGRGPDWVVVSAHIDGHPHGESAIDNATGVAVALALARALAPRVSGCPRGLRICLFSAEEWGLVGSRLWLERMDEAARRLMVINVNLDSVGGASGLTALTSGFEGLDAWVRDTAALAGLPIATHLPLMANSDHANFVAHGIPAVRLVAGFNAPDSNLRLLLTAADTRDKVRPDELDAALRLAATLTWQALVAADATLSSLAAVRRHEPDDPRASSPDGDESRSRSGMTVRR